MRRPMLTAALLALAAVLGGCSASDLAKPNLPPDTRLFVQFDASNGVPHTVPYEVKLSWLGLDEDGFVVAYEIRFKDPSRPADTTTFHGRVAGWFPRRFPPFWCGFRDGR